MEQGFKRRMDFAATPSVHRFRLLTLLTSACLTLPVLLNKPLFTAGAGASAWANDPLLSPGPGEKFGSVLVLGDRLGLGTEASRDAVRTGLGRIEALVFGRRISR